MKTQAEIVVKQLRETGQVSRNWALRGYISRLGAIICDLNKAGWNLEGGHQRTLGGYGRKMDYVYKDLNYKR